MNIVDENMKNIDVRKVEVGVRFKVFREIIDRTPEQLAAELEIPKSEIDSVEEGLLFPDIAYLHYLYENYGLNINWMIGKVGSMFAKNDPQKLGKIYAAKALVKIGESRFKQYRELMELMEIPAVEQSIMATLLEIKTLLKKQGREKNKKFKD
jgi:transcriptional regulator with XRE-family HTH domain